MSCYSGEKYEYPEHVVLKSLVSVNFQVLGLLFTKEHSSMVDRGCIDSIDITQYLFCGTLLALVKRLFIYLFICLFIYLFIYLLLPYLSIVP